MGPALSFTYLIGAVALERGVANDKRPHKTHEDGTAAALKPEVPPDMQKKCQEVSISHNVRKFTLACWLAAVLFLNAVSKMVIVTAPLLPLA